MSVQDVIKKSILQGFQNTCLTMGAAALLLLAAAVRLPISLLYSVQKLTLKEKDWVL